MPSNWPPGVSDALRWHRDGLVFQHISWMALQIQNKGRVDLSIPHPRPSNKGFDALMVPLKTTFTAHEVLFICEDKATDHPRDMVRDEVWPEIEKIENGDRDPELTSELTALLLMYKIESADAVIEAANWAKRKSYKICVTVSPKEGSLAWRPKVFKGFDEKVSDDDIGRRRADTLAISNLRQWMDQLCQKIEQSILTAGNLHV